VGRLTITYGDVKAAGACSERYVFKRLFGKRWPVPVTYTIAKTYARQLDWQWGARAFLDDAHRRAFASAVEAWRSPMYPMREEDFEAYHLFMAVSFVREFIDQGGIED
jgi:hypothetical protein